MSFVKRYDWGRLRPHLLALIVFACLTGLTLDNLLRQPANFVPGYRHGDYAIFHWDLWWMKFALFDLKQSPFTTTWMVYPFEHSLAPHTLVPFWGLLSLPLQPFFNLTLILNLFITLSFLLNAYLTFLFARVHKICWPLAVLAGLIFAFTPPLVHRATETHLNMLPMWWLPLALLMFDGFVRWQRWQWAVGLAITFYAAWLVDFQFMMWLPLVVAPYVLYHLFTQPALLKKKFLSLLGGSALIFLALSWFYPLNALLALPTTFYPQATLATAQAYSFPLSALLDNGRADFTIGRVLGPLAFLLSLVSGKVRQKMFWWGVGLGAFVLALGPFLLFSSGTEISLPYRWLHELLGGFYRAPVRFAVVTVFCLSMIVALSGQVLIDRWSIRPINVWLGVGVIMGVFVWDYGLWRSFPVFTPTTYETYQQIGEDNELTTLLEIPLGIDSGYDLFGQGHQLIFYQPAHHKPILNGALSRMPSTAVDYYRSFPLLEAFAGQAPLPESAAADFPPLLEIFKIGYILVHQDLLTNPNMMDLPYFLASHPSLCFWRQEGDLLAFRVRPRLGCSPVTRVKVGLADPLAWSYLGPGWYDAENIGGVEGRWSGELATSIWRFDLVPQDYELTFQAIPFPPDQQLTLAVNHVEVDQWLMPGIWNTYTVTIPAELIVPGEPTYIYLQHSQMLSAHEQSGGQSPDERLLGAAYAWLDLQESQ